MSESSETETVGYKRPPIKTQFKPGNSGNPRGRPPKSKVNMGQSLSEALDAKILVTSFQKPMTGQKALVQSLVDRVLQGEAQAIPALMRLFNRTGQFKVAPRPEQETGVVVVRPTDWFT
jgi:Family of unknown function (DUF5681)